MNAIDRQRRSRLGEQLARWLEQIDKRHEDYLINKIDLLPALANVPVLILNCDEEFEANSEVFKRHLEKIQQFIHKTMMHAPLKKTGIMQPLKD